MKTEKYCEFVKHGQENMLAKEKYYAFVKWGMAIEKETDLYLIDTCVDRENALGVDGDSRDKEIIDGSELFWVRMLSAGQYAFGCRCEDYRIDPAIYGIDY